MHAPAEHYEFIEKASLAAYNPSQPSILGVHQDGLQQSNQRCCSLPQQSTIFEGYLSTACYGNSSIKDGSGSNTDIRPWSFGSSLDIQSDACIFAHQPQPGQDAEADAASGFSLGSWAGLAAFDNPALYCSNVSLDSCSDVLHLGTSTLVAPHVSSGQQSAIRPLVEDWQKWVSPHAAPAVASTPLVSSSQQSAVEDWHKWGHSDATPAAAYTPLADPAADHWMGVFEHHHQQGAPAYTLRR